MKFLETKQRRSKRTIIIRAIEILIIVGTIILTYLAINKAAVERGYAAYGGEYSLPILGVILIVIIDKLK